MIYWAMQNNLSHEQILESIINHIQSNTPLPEGVKITKVLDIESELKSALENLQDQEPDLDLSYEIKEDINKVYPMNSLEVVAFDVDPDITKGAVSIPKKVVYYVLEGEPEHIELFVSWFIVSSVGLAVEIRFQTGEIINKGIAG